MQRNGHDTVEEYIRSLNSGEEKGFGFFFREFYAALTYFSFKMTSDRMAAEEIAGEVLLKLWERRTAFDNVCSIKSFLYTSARNASLNCIRQQKAANRRAKEFSFHSASYETSIFNHIVEAETYRELFTAINSLPPQCRQIFRMLFLEGKNYREIAGRLNLSVSTIRNQKARAIQLLKQRVAFCIFPLLSFFCNRLFF